MLLRVLVNFALAFFFAPCILVSLGITHRSVFLPTQTVSWHHGALYFKSRNHFLKIYLYGQRGKNEKAIFDHLRELKYERIFDFLHYTRLHSLEFLLSPLMDISAEYSQEIIAEIEKELLELGVHHGDLRGNVFHSKNQVYVTDFAFSRFTDGEAAPGHGKDFDVFRAKSEKLFFLVPYTDVIEEIFRTRTTGKSTDVGFLKFTLATKIIFKILRFVSPTLFTLAFIKYSGLRAHTGKNICLFDCPYIQYLSKRVMDRSFLQVVVYYWNPVRDVGRLSREKEVFTKIATYSIKDSEIYNLFFIPQFYKHKKNNQKPSSANAQNKVLFVGQAKPGRQEKLSKLLDALPERNKFRLFIVGGGLNQKLKRFKSKRLSYSEVVSEIYKCDTILDLNEHPGYLSLRPLEALYFGKRLITDNTRIFQEITGYDDHIKILDDYIDNSESSPLWGDRNPTAADNSLYNKHFSVNRFIEDLKFYAGI